MNILLEGDSGGTSLPSGIISNVSNSNNNKKESIKEGNAAPTGKTPANKSEKVNINEKEKRPKTDQKTKDPPKKPENQPNKVLIAASPVPQKKIVFQQPSNVPNQQPQSKNIKEKPKEIQKEKKEDASTPKSK